MTRFPNFLRHPLSIVGSWIALSAALLFVLVFALELFGYHTNPYVGIIFFLIVPSLFIFGLVLVPIGTWLERRRRAAGRVQDSRWPVVDLNNPRSRQVVLLILVTTIANVLIVSLASYRGVEYMDSVAFCGQVCHEVMEPEFVAYQDGPHSRVTCVQCHIGPGAPWFVKSKLSGARQVLAVMMNSHSRPIPSPVENLRPATDTCMQCHWPEKFHDDKIRTVKEYAEDEQNTETTTTLRVHVGGGSEKLGIAAGIHWHMNVANEIEYIASDDKRQVIPYVRLKDRSGNVREYFAEGVAPSEYANRERRRMDCMDCHTRPSHPFAASASRAVNEAMALGAIPKDLPFVKREVVAALEEKHPNQQVAADAIAARLREVYRKNYGKVYMERREHVERAVQEAQRLYRRNVFPAMNVTWGSYPNNIGHMDFPGCFRCHDENHKTAGGAVIRQDCELCHKIE